MHAMPPASTRSAGATDGVLRCQYVARVTSQSSTQALSWGVDETSADCSTPTANDYARTGGCRLRRGYWWGPVRRGAGVSGGEGGIRTHGRLRDTRSPGVPDRPLQHLSAAERVGFEPTVHCCTPLFESGTISHSVTSPNVGNYTIRQLSCQSISGSRRDV